MRDSVTSDLFFLKNILLAMDSIEAHLNQRSFTEEVVKQAIVFQIMTIGESVTKLSPDLKLRYPAIAWNKLAGMRHKIVHEYFHIDYELVERIVHSELPILHKQIETILAEMQ
jgi:uncharacterized protein with HEPN domain